MSTYKWTRPRFLISVLLLLHLIALLLPANKNTALAQAGTCGGGSVQAARQPAMIIASADEEVEIPKKEVDRALYDASWRVNYFKHYEAEHIIHDLLFKNAGKEVYSSLSTEFAQKFNEAMAQNDSWLSGNNLDEMVQTAFDLAWQTPELRYAVAATWRNLIDGESIFNDTQYELAQSARRYSMHDKMVELSEDARIEIYDCAQEDPEYAEAYDELQKANSNNPVVVSIRDDAKTILNKVPNLPIPQALRDGIREDGTIKISLNELKELTEIEFKNIHTTIDGMQKTLVEIDQQQDVIITYLKDQEAKAKWQEEMKKKAESNQLKLDAAKASISILSTLVGQIDPELGKQIGTVGSSTLQVGLALNGWLKAVSGLKGLDKVTSLSTVVMTGNVLGAVMNVMALFGEAKPTPEQMILEEIGKLRQQVDQLRQEMHSRFDRIDQELNAIYTTMNDRFNQIDVQLGKINGNIREIQQTLVSLDLKLSRIERNNFEMLNAIGRRPLLNAINGGLGYEERTGLQMPYEPDFIGYENEFHTWGTVHAFDPGNAGPTQRDYSDVKVAEELSTYPLDLNVNYLNGWLMAHGLPTLTDKYLASSRDWLFASRAYTQLGMEWPKHIKAVDPGRHKALDQVAYEISAAMQNISTRQTATGPQGNTLLFSTVITQYQNKLDALDSAIQSVERSYINEIQFGRLQRAESFNLYGGISQPLTYVSPELSNTTCGNLAGYGTYPLASNLKALIPNFDLYNLAEYLKLGGFAVCLSDEWLNPIEYCDTDPERPNDPPECYYVAQHKAILTVYFDAVSIMSQSLDEGDQIMPNSRPNEWTKDNWTTLYNYKAQFEALSMVDSSTPELEVQRAQLRTSIANKLETALGNYQHELYGRILTGLTTGSLKGMATEVAGSKALLDAFTTLGLPRAVSGDEFMHAMLYGDQQVVGDSKIMQSYAMSVTQPITGSSLLVNPRLVIKQIADDRITVFSEMIDEYLAAITAKEHVEVADYIANARFALDLTMRVVQLDEPASPATPTPPVARHQLHQRHRQHHCRRCQRMQNKTICP